MKRLLIGLIILYGIVIRLIGITYSFGNGVGDILNTLSSLIAKNYIKLGYLSTKFLAVINTREGLEIYYNNHPTLSPVILSLSYKLFGVSELSTRIPPVIFSVATLIIFFMFAKLFWNTKVVYLSTLFMATMPMQVIYSQMMDYQGSILLFFAISTIYFYSKWFLTHKSIYLSLFFISFILGELTNWPIFFLAPFLGIHYFIYSPRNDRLRISLYVFAVNIILFLALIYYLIAAKGSLGLLGDCAVKMGLSGKKVSFFSWLYNISGFSLYLFTPFILLLSFLWLIYDGIRSPFSEKKALLFVLFLFGFLHITIFNNGSYNHDFWLFYLTPWTALSSAVFLDRFEFRFSKRNIIIAITCIFIGITVMQFFIKPVKRYSWSLVYLIFCIVPFISAFIANLKEEKRLKIDLILISIIFYLTLSCLEVVWERNYWRADDNKRVGLFIKSNSTPEDAIIIAEGLPVLAFYADRKRVVVDSLNEFDSYIKEGRHKYRFFIMRVNGPKDLFTRMSKNYKMIRMGEYLIFDMRRNG